MPTFPLPPKDALGRILKVGDVVRVIGVPDLKSMAKSGLYESLPAFRHLVGTYRRIQMFDEHGLAQINFLVRRGPIAAWHGVAIEPFLLRRKDALRRPTMRSTPTRRKRRAG
jgi:hypothetical protein